MEIQTTVNTGISKNILLQQYRGNYVSSSVDDSDNSSYKTVHVGKDGKATILEYYDDDNDDTPPTTGGWGANSENGNGGEPYVCSIPCDTKEKLNVTDSNGKIH